MDDSWVERCVRVVGWVLMAVFAVPMCAVWDLLDLTRPAEERTRALRAYWEILR